MTSEFDPPPKKLSILVVVGGVVTAMIAIFGLKFLSNYLSERAKVPQQEQTQSQQRSQQQQQTKTPEVDPELEARAQKIALLDAQSVELPGTKVTSREIKAVRTPYIPSGLEEFGSEEMAIARQAWRYFDKNWNEETGLVNSVDDFTSVTLWDQSAAMAALVSAKELGIIPKEEFQAKMSQMLKTLAELPLYKTELPNKVYNSKTLIPVNYGQIDKKEEIGWSAIDLGRLALWLKIVGAKYPQFKSQTEAVWDSWLINRLTDKGHMYGTSVVNGKEQYNQEGRLGYENYAAYGLKLWGLKVEKALDFEDKAVFVNLYGKGIPYDIRDDRNSGANNYVLSEPYFLDGIETGFRALPKAHADRLLAAQEARYQKTNVLTAITEDNLDRAPYFVYNTLFVNGKPWSTIIDTGENYNKLRFLSTKAAIGWHVIYNTDYTRKLYDFVQNNLKTDDGWYGGFYEYDKKPNKSLTANNNGIVLECMLYLKVKKPLMVWAGVRAPK